jgi:hypothetical protein
MNIYARTTKSCIFAENYQGAKIERYFVGQIKQLREEWRTR